MKHYTWTIFLIITCIGHPSLRASEIELTTFTNAKYGFKFRYPSYCNEIIAYDVSDKAEFEARTVNKILDSDNLYLNSYGFLNHLYSFDATHHESHFYLSFGVYLMNKSYLISEAAIETCRIREMYPDVVSYCDTIEVDGARGIACQFYSNMGGRVIPITPINVIGIERGDYNYIVIFGYDEEVDPEKHYNSYYEIVDLICKNVEWLNHK